MTQLKIKLSPKSQRDYVTVLKSIFDCACDEYNLNLRDPFRKMGEFIPKDKKDKAIDTNGQAMFVLRYDEVVKIIANIHDPYRNATKLLFLTGLSGSEVAGLTKTSIQGEKLLINNFISSNGEKDVGKCYHRTRRIPITRAIKECLDEALRTSQDEYLFRTVTGRHFSSKRYRGCWETALSKSGVKYVKPYSTRHTFAAWALAVGFPMDNLVGLMGHASKEMIYEVYGKWKDGIEKDRNKIRDFFGEDFGE